MHKLHPLSAEAVATRRALFGGYTMVATGSGDVIDPEVWADMAQAEFTGALRLVQAGAILADSTLEGQPGSTVEFGKWDTLTDLVDLAETDVLVPEAMGTSNQHATIKEAGKAVAIKDRARLVSLGDPEAEARRQFGILAARKIEKDALVQAQADETALGGSTPLSFAAVTGKTKLTYLDYLAPSVAAFGDEWDPSLFAGLFINPAQFADLIVDPNFIDQGKSGAPSPVITGQVGTVLGVPVAMTSLVAVKKFLLIKRNAIGVLYKRRPLVESDRDILARENVITTTQHYAVKRLSDKGVLVGTVSAT